MLYVVYFVYYVCFFFLFKQKTAYELRISDWSSDVCSSDLVQGFVGVPVLDVCVEPSVLFVKAGFDVEGGIGAGIHLVVCLFNRRKTLLECNEIGRASCRERVCQYV